MQLRKTIALGLLSLALSTGVAHADGTRPVQAAPERWTAHEAVRFALISNPDSAIGRQRLAAAQAAIDLERANRAPQLSLIGQYSQTNTPMYSFGNILNQGEFSNSINFNDPGRTDSVSSGLQLGYRLYDGGRDHARIEAAQAESAAVELELSSTHSRLAFEVVRSFYSIRQALELINVYQTAVEAVASSLKVAQARHAAGVLLLDAVLDLEVQLSQAKENLIQSQHALALARKVFLTLLGLAEGSTELAAEADSGQEPPLANACVTRCELKALDAMINAAEARLRQAQRASAPTVDSFAGYGFEQGTVTGGNGDAWQAGVKLHYPLYDGNRTAAEVVKAMAGLDELRERRQKLDLAIGLEIEQARLKLREAEERLQVTEKTVAQAKESAEINRARFTEGVVLPSDLIAVENRLTEAMTRRSMAQTARLVAVAELRRASGLPQFDDLPEVAGQK